MCTFVHVTDTVIYLVRNTALLLPAGDSKVRACPSWLFLFIEYFSKHLWHVKALTRQGRHRATRWYNHKMLPGFCLPNQTRGWKYCWPFVSSIEMEMCKGRQVSTISVKHYTKQIQWLDTQTNTKVVYVPTVLKSAVSAGVMLYHTRGARVEHTTSKPVNRWRCGIFVASTLLWSTCVL